MSAEIELEKIGVILATDCGSTTTKARLFSKLGTEYRFIASGEAPTTVEAPYEDVTLGARNAIRELEELTKRRLLHEGGIITPSNNTDGCDIYVTTSSAGGGLQMLIAGVIKSMSAESAERVALGAGAIVMETIAIDDRRRPDQRISMIRHLRPDMILLSGGTDGGASEPVGTLAETMLAADPKPRLGVEYTLPIVYAGNKELREQVKDFFTGKFALKIVDNIRPALETENPEPARDAIHELFMEHVMSHAPGYDRLMKWTPLPIMPTPAAEGLMFRTVARLREVNLIGVGLGGATTNVYSVYNEKFVRTVSANLGMSYSICNVLKESGIDNIKRWIPFYIDEIALRDTLRNKMIRPTTIPETVEELIIEHAVAREALRLGFQHHKLLARGLRGIRRQRELSEIFSQQMDTGSYLDMSRIDMLCGTGGLLSHAPRRAQAALIMMDGFLPEGITMLAQDSVFMIPHLGILSTVHPQAALEIFEKDCLVKLGACVAPVYKGDAANPSETIASVEGVRSDGARISERIQAGEVKRTVLKEGERAEINVVPSKGFDVGAGPSEPRRATVEGGTVGLIMDGRGRPINIPKDDSQRIDSLISWLRSLEVYPEETLSKHGKR